MSEINNTTSNSGTINSVNSNRTYTDTSKPIEWKWFGEKVEAVDSKPSNYDYRPTGLLRFAVRGTYNFFAGLFQKNPGITSNSSNRQESAPVPYTPQDNTTSLKRSNSSPGVEQQSETIDTIVNNNSADNVFFKDGHITEVLPNVNTDQDERSSKTDNTGSSSNNIQDQSLPKQTNNKRVQINLTPEYFGDKEFKQSQDGQAFKSMLQTLSSRVNDDSDEDKDESTSSVYENLSEENVLPRSRSNSEEAQSESNTTHKVDSTTSSINDKTLQSFINNELTETQVNVLNQAHRRNVVPDFIESPDLKQFLLKKETELKNSKSTRTDPSDDPAIIRDYMKQHVEFSKKTMLEKNQAQLQDVQIIGAIDNELKLLKIQYDGSQNTFFMDGEDRFQEVKDSEWKDSAEGNTQQRVKQHEPLNQIQKNESSLKVLKENNAVTSEEKNLTAQDDGNQQVNTKGGTKDNVSNQSQARALLEATISKKLEGMKKSST